jgi:biotin carboxyl carrier protein
MPGTIRDISVSTGQSVAAGQCLMVMEAMKMEHEIVAPRAGVVKQILFAKGASADTGDVLIVLS